MTMQAAFVLFNSGGSIIGIHAGISIADYAAKNECRVEWGSEGGTLCRLDTGRFVAGFNLATLHTHGGNGNAKVTPK